MRRASSSPSATARSWAARNSQPLSAQVAEVRSLVVDPSARSLGVGGMIVDELRARARREGFDKLCAFTHAPGYFMPMGFSIVPHLWVAEKVYTDCVKCPLLPQLRPVRDGAAARSHCTTPRTVTASLVARHA